mgnify:CR=1 FL=1
MIQRTRIDRLREVGKWRVVPLTPEAHRALVLHVRQQAGQGEEYDIAERMAEAASAMVMAAIERAAEADRVARQALDVYACSCSAACTCPVTR